jgi:succinylglutamate desuccinylase
MSATSSTFTYVGHKEDAVVKRISELLASRLKTKVVVSAGIHWDDLTSREIDIIAKLTQKLSAQILKKLEASR